ncbi:zinc-dependent alcohol dehydrogenase [Nocardioides marmoribigeumensis]|uniref:Threonine dehydrogenase-like Zn-dependent dehydrogenase n=1 Tax=Nocardioides marmoribigeumensis TaxID=433649 RepID=A0ABU2C0J0_9ACTN|nr:zinc-binding alcohol dehydrogenase [Nocardioides marmoribigeumensis]MDR7364172.1 threonine dehydrogenase-like Zn-dependent dehydrogenase [Nocardioides marmoribigeumensis]
MTRTARALWVTGPCRCEIRSEPLPEPGAADVLVRTRFSAVSRGTERLVLRGGVPADQRERMRAPHQVGDFPWPVKYGYLSVGVVVAGAPDLVGRDVFCLHPHQTAYVVPARDVTPLPEGVPARRGVLVGAVETAVNALWDVPPLLGDRVTVVGAGMVGCAAARLLAGVPGVEVTLVDLDASRGAVAETLGVRFALPEAAPGEQDLVLHASATPEGLALALGLLTTGGTVTELSWYGDRVVPLPLGGDFHSRRLALRSTQVGTVSPTARSRWDHAGRRSLALDLLRDPAYDALLTGTTSFEDLPDLMARVAQGAPGICRTIAYDGEDADVQPDRA